MSNPLFGRLAVLLLALTAAGCVGIRSQEDVFRSSPDQGMSEVELFKEYGKPDYSWSNGDESVHIYRVWDEKYIVLIGVSDTYDLVVTCRGGVVEGTEVVRLGTNISVFQPSPWNVSH